MNSTAPVRAPFYSRLWHSESFRLAATYAIIFMISILLFGALVYYTVDTAFRAEALRSADTDIAAVASGYASEGVSEAQEVISQSLSAMGSSDYLLLERAGIKLAGNLPAMPATTGIVALSQRHRRVLGRGAFLAPDLYVFAGRDLSIKNRAEESILRALAWVFGSALIVAAAGGVLLSRSFLTRMDEITRTCRAIMEGRLADRIPVRGGQDELDGLAIVINDMLDRIASLMENLKQVSSDIAHDLRTPLTRLRNRLERAGSEAKDQAAYAAVLNSALAETDEILGLFAALLRIAQIESGSRRAGFATVDLAGLLHHVAEIYRPVAEDAGHDFMLQVQGTAAIQGDRELLIQLLANLVENAIRHTPSGVAIVLGLGTDRGKPVLFVSDAGPGIPPDQKQNLFRRFTRLEQSRTTPGNGLGLALVAAIADLHGAAVTIADNQPGTRVNIRFGD